MFTCAQQGPLLRKAASPPPSSASPSSPEGWAGHSPRRRLSQLPGQWLGPATQARDTPTPRPCPRDAQPLTLLGRMRQYLHNKQLGQCWASEESGMQTSMTQGSLSPADNQPVPSGTHAASLPRQADAGQYQLLQAAHLGARQPRAVPSV